MKRTALFVLLVAATGCCFQLIDPFDMNIPSKVAMERSDRESEDLENKISYYSQLYKRMILLILNNVSLKNGQYDTHIYVNILQNDYNFLKMFAENRNDDIDTLTKVDEVLSKILHKPFKEHIFGLVESWTDFAHYLFFNRTTAILLGVLTVLIVIYKMLKANFTFKYIIRYLLFLGWIYDFAVTWLHLLQEKELEQQADSMRYKSIPVYCNPEDMSWWQYVWNAISTKDECREYYRTMYTDNFFRVAPIEILSKQFGTAVVTPAKDIGKAFGTLTISIMDSLPFGLNLVLLPLILIFIGVTFCMTFAFLTKTKVKLNVFPFFKLEFGGKDSESITDTFHKLIDTHREMVQDIFHVVKSDHNKQPQIKNESDKVAENSNEKEDKSDLPTSSASKTPVHDGSGDASEDHSKSDTG